MDNLKIIVEKIEKHQSSDMGFKATLFINGRPDMVGQYTRCEFGFTARSAVDNLRTAISGRGICEDPYQIPVKEDS